MDNREEVLSSLEHIHKEVINNPRTMDTLEEEFFVYQAMSDADVPAHIWKESKVVEKLDDDGNEVTYHQMELAPSALIITPYFPSHGVGISVYKNLVLSTELIINKW